MRYSVTSTHTLLSDVYLKDRTLRSSSTSPGEILSSHRWCVYRNGNVFEKPFPAGMGP